MVAWTRVDQEEQNQVLPLDDFHHRSQTDQVHGKIGSLFLSSLYKRHLSEKLFKISVATRSVLNFIEFEVPEH